MLPFVHTSLDKRFVAMIRAIEPRASADEILSDNEVDQIINEEMMHVP